MVNDLPLITVIVCTRARRALLERCLESLLALDDPNHEVLIVENDDVPTAARLAGGKVYWVHEPRAGLAFARNRGIQEARGEFVAFVDDDCEVSADWLTELREGFRDPAVSCVTGRVVPAETRLPSERWFERLASFDRGPDVGAFLVPPGSVVMPNKAAVLGTGCNMAFRRDVFDRVGTFDTALDTPSLIRGGGDLDMFVRVLEASERAAYVPRAVVRHHHRGTLLSLARQLFGYGVGLGALSVKYLVDDRTDLRTVLRFQAQLIRSMFRRGLTVAPLRSGSNVIGMLLNVIEIVGDLVGPFAYLAIRSRNRLRADS